MKVHLKALGCRLNEAELEQWSQQFQAEGYTISRVESDADLVVLNTCAVTNEASRKSRYLINRLHRENPTAKLVVTGCHASLEPEQVADTLGVDLVIRNDQKSQLPTIARDQLDLPTMPLSATEPDDIALYSRGRHRAFIKVQDGCRYRCTFCIVTIARGEEQSRCIEEITAEIRRFHDSGIQEVVLTGVHVGGYGSDTGTDLFTLVQAILNETDIPRIRFASVEPWDLPDNFFDLFRNTRVMPHMHLPLQSGSDTILRRMARRCKTAEFRRLADRAREAVSGFNITSDIIVGFPGETSKEWEQTLQFA
ncbi:MAG TPA: MiaB/RimO family radical SAM methylthiotransferase, partial [Gammaproteobacteria bacterium]|nr:MiaB/RimO family radical SAM methylthiotransferase [Gammaproteobacteria bacterium]